MSDQIIIGTSFQGPEDPRLQQALDILPVGAYFCDLQGVIRFFNVPALRIWGQAPRLDVLTDRLFGPVKTLHPNHSEFSLESSWITQALTTREPGQGQEALVCREEGTRCRVLAYGNPVFNQSGALIGAIGLLVEISPQSKIEKTRAQLSAIVESTDDAIISKTLDGIIVSWNRGAEQIFGYTAEEAVGSSIMMLIPPDRHYEEASILDRLHRGIHIDHYETIRQRKDGRRIDVSLTVSPMWDQQGNVMGASKIARDVTAQREADAALVALNDQLSIQLADVTRLHEMSMRLTTNMELKTILEECLRTAAAISDAEKGLLFLHENDRLEVRASFGFEADSLDLFKDATPAAGPEERCFAEGRRLLIADINVDPHFAALREPFGAAKIRSVSSTPLISRKGEVLGVLNLYQQTVHLPGDRESRMIDLCARQTVDFIENVRLYDQLQDSHRRKDEFLATLGHELRNPLAPISNALQIMQMSNEIGPSLQQVRDIMEQQVAYMVRLIDDLLEVSRITRGKIELRKENVDIAPLIAGAVEMTRNQFEENQVKLSITLPAEPVVLHVDPIRMTQVIANLLGNAAKYTDAGGQAWLTASRSKDEFILSVRDTGAGIPPDMLEQIFEMFSQVDRTFNRARGGLGIGLTLSRSLISLHGGSISAHSEGPGTGTEMKVHLPVSNARPLRSSPPKVDPDDLLLPVRRRILVVDDTRAATYVLSRLLESLGQEVQVANDGETALQLLSESTPEIVFSDIAMPLMDGYELATRIRQLGFLDLTLVAVTGFGQREDRERARAAGFDFHLVKPASVQSIRELLSAVPVGTDAVASAESLPDC